MPALQNAEIEWKTAHCRRSSIEPPVSTKTRSNAAPTASTRRVIVTMPITRRRKSPSAGALIICRKTTICGTGRVLFERLESSATNVTTPNPPIWMSASSTVCPKVLNSVPMSRTTRPVTLLALADMNTASTQVNGGTPAAIAFGNFRSAAPTAMINAKEPAKTISARSPRARTDSMPRRTCNIRHPIKNIRTIQKNKLPAGIPNSPANMCNAGLGRKTNAPSESRPTPRRINSARRYRSAAAGADASAISESHSAP